MDHFELVHAICRAGLARGDSTVRGFIEKLRDQLLADGEQRQAGSLTRMISATGRSSELVPSRLRRAGTIFGGEPLTRSTVLPVDKETSSPLVQVVPVDELPQDAPVIARGMSQAIESLLEEWAHLEELKLAGVEPPSSALFFGAPGTGKTHMALWIASQLQLPVVIARLDGLVSSFLGTTSRNIGSLFAFASRYRCLLLLDEFDAIAKMRDDPQEVGEIKRVVNTLLQNLDLRSTAGLTIAITNHELLLDPAVWRRFDIQVPFGKPDFLQAQTIVRRYAEPLQLQDAEVKVLAWLFSGVSGADIETAMRSLRRTAVLRGKDAINIVNFVKTYATLNSGRFEPEIRELLLERDEEKLARAVVSRRGQLGIDKTAISKMFGVHRTTLNRWANDSETAERAYA